MNNTHAIFCNRESGALVEVVEVDASYAKYVTLGPLGGSYSMPIAEYDRLFVEWFRPATADDLAPREGGSFRLPANAPDDWREGARLDAAADAETP